MLFDDPDHDPDPRADGDALLVVELDGFEGPLDLLLDLARKQKVDLHMISISALAEQYLAFIENARTMRLELAADYLVMAAWLAYLKSRLLLPEPPRADGPSAADLAMALAARLRRLEAIREAARLLERRDRLGRDVFARGHREETAPAPKGPLTATLYDLLSAYARQRQRAARTEVRIERRRVWSLAEARSALERLLGLALDWVELDSHLLRYCAEPRERATVLASSLSATLELVREGRAVLRQDGPFAPLFIRAGTAPQGAAP